MVGIGGCQLARAGPASQFALSSVPLESRSNIWIGSLVESAHADEAVIKKALDIKKIERRVIIVVSTVRERMPSG